MGGRYSNFCNDNDNVQLMASSSQSCRFVFFLGAGGGDTSGCCPTPSLLPSSTVVVVAVAVTPSTGRLTRLRPSSSVAPAELSAMLGGALVDMRRDEARTAEPRICWISSVMRSVFMASRMLAVAVGSSASTVNVQSSWFCSKRRRRLAGVVRIAKI